MQYTLDKHKFKRRLLSLGYKNLYDFAAKNNIHRNTLHDLFQGKSVFLNSFEKIAKKLEMDPLELLLPKSEFSNSIPNSDEIRPIVARLVKKRKKMAVVLLGSRAIEAAKKYSDWDIGIFSHSQPVTGMEYLQHRRLAEELAENMVRKVDLVNLNQAPSWFLENLKDSCLFLDGDHESFIYLKGVIDGIQRESEAT